MVVLSLGSNMGDRQNYLRSAIGLLEQNGLSEIKISSLYQTAPWGVNGQDDYYNMVVVGKSQLSPSEFLTLISKIELELGRERSFQYAPRTIDIDIIFYNQQQVELSNLKIPHPLYQDRKFVLLPLLEIVPEYRDYVTGRELAEIFINCRDNSPVTNIGKL